MRVKKIINIILIFSLLLITGCSNRDIIVKNNESEEISFMKAIIDGNEYIVNLENNETAKEFLNYLPQKLAMSELNGNEKYVYLDYTLPVNVYNSNKIISGDIMLYGNNCLVIFYKSFSTSYSYSKIGHIDNLPDLKDNNISVIFER